MKQYRRKVIQLGSKPVFNDSGFEDNTLANDEALGYKNLSDDDNGNPYDDGYDDGPTVNEDDGTSDNDEPGDDDKPGDKDVYDLWKWNDNDMNQLTMMTSHLLTTMEHL